MLKTAYCKYDLRFIEPAKTSRCVMTEKETYFIKVWDADEPHKYGIGECPIFRGLSAEDSPNYESKIRELCRNINNEAHTDITQYSSLKFGLETALLDYENGCCRKPFPSSWSKGDSAIPINGLVWMGTIDEMSKRVDEKIAQGFRCVKLKVGACDFEEELKLLGRIRLLYSPEKLEIRLDANGAFTPDEALVKLKRLSQLDIHSIEQPIKAGQWDKMAYLCENSPIDIALDEELIGIYDIVQMRKMLYYISPKYIILKPALCGGISGAVQWINCANAYEVGWWVTSALESNIGLNAIAQWVSTLETIIPQGLGTGALYSNNIASPIEQIGDVLTYNEHKHWNIPDFKWIIPE